MSSATTRRRSPPRHDEVATALRDLLLRIPNLPASRRARRRRRRRQPGRQGSDRPGDDPAAGRRAPAGAPLGDRRPSSASSTTSGPSRSPARCSPCTAARAPRWRGRCASRPRPQRRRLRGGPAAVAGDYRRRSPPRANCPKFADDAYAIERDDLWCIPTAEVPLTSIYADEILDDADLPIRMMALHAVLPPRGRLGRARHPRPAARPRVRQGRDPGARRPPSRPPRLLDEIVAAPRAHRRARASPTGSSRSAPATWARATTAGSTSRSTRRASTSGWRCRRSAGSATTRPGGRTSASAVTTPTASKGTEFVHTLNGSALAVPRVWAAIVETTASPTARSAPRGAAAVHARHRADRAPVQP